MPGKIAHENGHLRVPDDPLVAVLYGDGIGPEVVTTALKVVDKAVDRAYGGARRLHWREYSAGAEALRQEGDILPPTTLQAIREYGVALKGPMTTPVGQGYRSANVALRQQLDLYANVRPVRYFPGVPSPLLRPELLDVVIFRENTEDVYAGVEYAAGSKEAVQLIETVRGWGSNVREGSAVGLKPISEFASKRLIRRAIEYSLAKGRRKITLVHKGNIMKFTEGAFRNWGYELARELLGDRLATPEEADADHNPPPGKILVQDKIADAMFQDLIRRPQSHEVIVTTNLNGDYLSDAAAAQVGGLGMAPGANFGDGVAVFEAVHGSAPQYAGQDKVNPTSVILSGAMMLDYFGWPEAARLIENAVEETIMRKIVTYDLAGVMDNATLVSCSGFGKMVEDAMVRG
ncbi:MAG: NADP-dependent isocitrate dehydrogenase [Myxococcales bacterium]|nr:NADP-dependent isocitrate dehydrogenase [Myxococcales bacterium]